MTSETLNADAVTAELIAALRQCQSALAMMVAPDAIKQTTVVNAWAAAFAAEAAARAALAKAVSHD